MHHPFHGYTKFKKYERKVPLKKLCIPDLTKYLHGLRNICQIFISFLTFENLAIEVFAKK